MNVQHEVVISAPAAHVWEVFTDVERWPDWTPSVTRASIVDGGPTLNVGTRVRIRQPRMPALEWVVRELEAGRSWTWFARSPGVTTSATHLIDEIDESTCRVRQHVDHRGAFAGVIGRLTRRRTRRYLVQEAAGLKQRCETTWTLRAASA
jgi:uncharacterized protein YndB with AHSA1/START domain